MAPIERERRCYTTESLATACTVWQTFTHSHTSYLIRLTYKTLTTEPYLQQRNRNINKLLNIYTKILVILAINQLDAQILVL